MPRRLSRVELAKLGFDHQADGSFQEILDDTRFLIERQLKTVRRRSEHDPQPEPVPTYIRAGIGAYIALALRELGTTETSIILMEQLQQIANSIH